jgi:hypothetical protein
MGVLITAIGRSGTKFLATRAARSKQWTCFHERTGDYLYQNVPQQVHERFISKNYLEVNGYLRHVALDIKNIEKIRVIVRNPDDILKSMLSRRPQRSTAQQADILLKELHSLDSLICNTTEPISFNKMTSDKQYLLKIFHWIGIDDIPISQLSLDKVNKTIKKRDIDHKEFSEIIDQFSWFKEKYSDYII